MKKTIIFNFILSICIINHCIAQQQDNPMKSKIDSTVDNLVKVYFSGGKRVGLSLGINYGGKDYFYNYGETSPGSCVLPTEKSIYEIGSITKTFTGLLVAHAIIQRRLSMNDDITKFLPGNFPNLRYPNGDPIKIGYLLAHTAQLPNSFDQQINVPINKASFLDSLHTVKLDSLKSFHYKYSNVGYQLLGLILEKIYRKSYEQLLKEYINIPLSMSQTKLSSELNDDKQLLSGYGPDRELIKSAPIFLPAAGGLCSSVSDLLKYLRFQNLESSPEIKLSHRILVGDIDNAAHAFQWELGKNWSWDQYMRIDGGINGFRTFCVIYPLHQISIVVLTNQKDESAGLGLYKIVTGVYNETKKLVVLKK